MNLKEFFKPESKKILLTLIILLVLWIVLPLVPVYEIVICKQGPCPPSPTFLSLTKVIENSQWIESLNMIPLIIELIIIYLISCTIISSYNKIRGRKI